MNSTVSTILWLIGFLLIVTFVPQKLVGYGKQGLINGFFIGIFWTSFIILITKKKYGKGQKIHRQRPEASSNSKKFDE